MRRLMSNGVMKSVGLAAMLAACGLPASPALAQQGTSWSSIQMIENGERYSVQIVDGSITSVEHNGERLAADRWRKTDEGIEILDGDGKVIKTIRVTMGEKLPGHAAPLRERAGARNFDRPLMPDAGQMKILEPDGNDEGNAERRVMLGITMGDHDDRGVSVESVVSDLPADKAGMKKGDLIKTIDGRDVEHTDDVRDVLKTKKPGEHIEVVVLRNGERKSLRVELEKYDAKKMRGAATAIEITPDLWRFEGLEPFDDGLGRVWGFGGLDEKTKEQVTKEIDEAIRELRGALHEALGEAADSLQDAKRQARMAIQDALDSLQAAKEKLAQDDQARGRDVRRRLRELMLDPDRNMVFRVPIQPDARQPQEAVRIQRGGNDDRVRAMEERLKELEEKIKKLEEK